MVIILSVGGKFHDRLCCFVPVSADWRHHPGRNHLLGVVWSEDHRWYPDPGSDRAGGVVYLLHSRAHLRLDHACRWQRVWRALSLTDMTTPNRYPRRPPEKPLSLGDWIVFASFVG